MKQRTDDKIIDFFKKMYPQASVRIVANKPKNIVVSLESLDSLTFFYDEMKQISEFFDTTKIKYEDIYKSEGGCPTCSYGDSYSFDVRIWEAL